MAMTKKGHQKPNAVIYARYSSTNQTEQSIEGQLQECLAFAEHEGYSVVGEYVDRALTGRTDERPQFQRMVADSASGAFQFIVVWKLDRFSRNRYDSAFYKNALKKNGVRVVSATERISSDPEGIILEGVIEAMSEYFSANLAQNVRRGAMYVGLKSIGVLGMISFPILAAVIRQLWLSFNKKEENAESDEQITDNKNRETLNVSEKIMPPKT